MLVAFGGVYPWTYPPAAIALGISAALLRPRVAARESRVVDVALICAIGWTIVQAVPLPVAWRDALSPSAAAAARAVRFDPATAPGTLSLDPAGTWQGVAVAVMVAVMFWVSREACARHGLRRLVRTIAWIGFAITVAAIAVLGSSPTRVYGIWDTGNRSAFPFGPFVNRNHMGTWLLMAVLLITGYIFARFQGRRKSIIAALDAPMIWLMGAGAAMFIAVVVALSRSAIVGTLAGGGCIAAFAALRRGRARWGVLIVILAAAALVATNPRALDLGRRFQDSRTTEEWSRQAIWRETWSVVRDFPLTGVGVGSYPAAMLVYQQSDRRFFFNQAHNHYLQVAAEGGIVLLALLAIAAIAFARQVAGRLVRDTQNRSAMFWIRAGAVAAIVGVLVQSIWETGLRMPANGLLFAAICGIAVHDDRHRRDNGEGGENG